MKSVNKNFNQLKVAVIIAFNALVACSKDSSKNPNDNPNPTTSNIEVTTLAGNGMKGDVDGTGTGAQFAFPQDIAIDKGGSIYVTDSLNNKIKKITLAGIVNNFAGNGEKGFQDVDGQSGNDNKLNKAKFDAPNGITIADNGVVYVSDTGNRKIRIINGNSVFTFTGSGIKGDLEGEGNIAQYNKLADIAFNPDGALYVNDEGSHKIKVVRSGGSMQIYANIIPGTQGYADGSQIASRFNHPKGIAINKKNGYIYIADSFNHRIRVIDPSSFDDESVKTIAGSTQGFKEGKGTEAKFNFPNDVAVDDAGNVYVADTGNHRIRKITPNGEVTTIAGSGEEGFTNGKGNLAKFNSPSGIAIDASGSILVVDKNNHSIRKIIMK